jgi:hypothetical protein
VYDLLVRVFIEMFDTNTLGEEVLRRLHLAAKIFFEREIFDYIISSIKTPKTHWEQNEGLANQARESEREAPFATGNNYNDGLEQAAAIIESNPEWFKGAAANVRVAEEIRKLKIR